MPGQISRRLMNWTPLHWAVAERQQMEVVKLLLDAQASVSTKDMYGDTPLALARIQGHREAVRLFQYAESNIDVNHNNFRQTPLSSAAWMGDTKVVKDLC